MTGAAPPLSCSAGSAEPRTEAPRDVARHAVKEFGFRSADFVDNRPRNLPHPRRGEGYGEPECGRSSSITPSLNPVPGVSVASRTELPCNAADNFNFTFLDDAHPEARRGFVIKVIPGLVRMRRAAGNDRGQVDGGNAHGLSEGANAFRSQSNIHGRRVGFNEVFQVQSCCR